MLVNSATLSTNFTSIISDGKALTPPAKETNPDGKALDPITAPIVQSDSTNPEGKALDPVSKTLGMSVDFVA
ncbi:MAG: hypothetical protein KDB65_06920 [Calditrichaeota bacterium]|nr:hypothetical protein [Calditrichota bacterium]MCB9369674.1 hypothetical protein [Calditrichota bacterium]